MNFMGGAPAWFEKSQRNLKSGFGPINSCWTWLLIVAVIALVAYLVWYFFLKDGFHGHHLGSNYTRTSSKTDPAINRRSHQEREKDANYEHKSCIYRTTDASMAAHQRPYTGPAPADPARYRTQKHGGLRTFTPK